MKESQEQRKEDRPEPKTQQPEEKYYRVRFNAKSNPNDTDDVQLSVNGETLQIQRDKDVVIPQRFLECADHTTYDQFRQLPNQPRKVVARLKTYPYNVIAPATKEEYVKQRADGTKKQKESIEKFGFDLNPETMQ